MTSPKRYRPTMEKASERLLARFSGVSGRRGAARRSDRRPRLDERTIEALVAADLVVRGAGGVELTEAGRAHLARAALARSGGAIDPFLGQHLALAERTIATSVGMVGVTVDDMESPLGWLARRKGKDGRPLIDPIQLQAGERLRADFTRAQLMPRITSNWTAAVADGGRSGDGAAAMTDMVVAARQRVNQALAAVGPEFSGLLVDVCCFLKGLEDVEGERGWPPRSAKVVLQLGLDRLARHYGLSREARGRARAPVRVWLAPGEAVAAGE
jgi:hypothetical protein